MALLFRKQQTDRNEAIADAEAARRLAPEPLKIVDGGSARTTETANQATAEVRAARSATGQVAKTRRRRGFRLTKRGAAITLGLSSLLGMRWIDANREPVWPAPLPAMSPKEMVGINGAHFYHAALESFTPYELPPATKSDPRFGDLTDAPLEFQRAAAERNADTLKWLHEGATHNYYGKDGGSWLKSPPTAPTLASPVTDFVKTRELARMAAGSSDVLAADGQTLAAFDRAADIVRFGSDMTHDPTLIEGMIGCLVQGIGYQKALAHADKLTASDARIALKRLADMPAPATFERIMRTEEALMASMFQDLFRSGDLRVLSSGEARSSIVGKLASDAIVLAYTKRGLVKNATDVFDEHARLAAMPYFDAKAGQQALSQRVTDGVGLNFVTRMVMPNFNRARLAYEKGAVVKQILMAKLALTVYKARHGGKLPESLVQLVTDEILERIPIDSFSPGGSQPLCYDPETGEIWSVGDNGIDDGNHKDDIVDTQFLSRK